MTLNDASELLRTHRERAGRGEYLKSQICRCEAILEEELGDLAGGAALPSRAYIGMPRGSGIGDPAGALGASLADGIEPPHVTQLRGDIRAMKRELADIDTVAMFVRAWLAGLNDRERWVIERKLIDGVSWSKLSKEYTETNGIYYSVDGLKKLRQRAMAKIQKMAC